MHEFTLIKNIFDVIIKSAKDNNLHRITVVRLKVGALRQVVPEFLQFAFEIAAKDTIAAGAKLEVEYIPITVLCRSCGARSTVSEHTYLCSRCESSDLEILTGKEVVIDSIEGSA